MAQRIKAIIGILFILVALLIFYIFAGASDADTFISYRIEATDPSGSWMDITITLRPSARPFVDLYLRDRRLLQKNRVRDISAARGERSLLTWEPFPSRPDIQRIWTGFSTEPVTIHYRAHGQWRQDGVRMESYLGPEYGYLRGEVFLYTPVAMQELLIPNQPVIGDAIGRAKVTFVLPPGWQIITPLDIEHLEVQTSVLRDVYFAVGQLGIEEIQLGSDTLKLGIWEGLPAEERAMLRAAIPVLYETTRSAAGFANSANTCFRALTVLPEEPIRGSVSGSGSLVVENRLPSIARSLFHWWTGSTIAAAPDAKWLEEGFTTYYQARLLFMSGLWSQAEFNTAMQEYQEQLWPGAVPQPINLVQASQRATNAKAPFEDSAIRYGGALLAYQLDLALHAQGSSLNALWPALAAQEQPVDTRAVLNALQTLGGSDLRATAQAVLYGQAAINTANQP